MRHLFLPVCVLAASVLACAHESLVELRVLVKTTQPAEPEAVAAQAARSAGVPARYVSAASPQWHALALSCRPADCDAALQRLGADRARFEVVQADERKQRSSP